MRKCTQIQKLTTGGYPLILKGIYNCSRDKEKKFITSNLGRKVYLNDIEVGDYLDMWNEENDFLYVGRITRIYRLEEENVVIDTDKDLTVSLSTF